MHRRMFRGEVTNMWMRDECGKARVAWFWATSVCSLLTFGCGQLVSWDERWIFDGDGDDHGAPAPSAGPAAPAACAAQPIEGYRYAEAPEHWPGSLEELDLSVNGLGYLVAGAAGSSQFFRAAALSVSGDGTLVLGDQPVLGYAPDATPGQCLVELRAPSASPPRPTSFVEVLANLDTRDPSTTFDVLDPAGSSNASISFMVFDSVGVQHALDVYVSHLWGGSFEYHVVADGSQLAGGVAGNLVELSMGWLTFDPGGALAEATTPPVYASFAGAAVPNQRIDLSWGADLVSGPRPTGTTALAADTFFYSFSHDGLAPGTGVGLYVTDAGNVVSYYDSGEALPIGTLALARFSRESKLEPLGDGWVPTAESGGALYGAPLTGGRGAILIGSGLF